MKQFSLSLALTLALSYASFAQTQIIFYTSMGDIIVEMSDSLTPITSGNFVSLVDSGFYDGILFHRVIDSFVIQGGDPPGAATGPGYTIPDEFDSTGTLSNIQYSIAMANAGPNTGGSQFYINLEDNVHLDYDKPPFTSAHPIFGHVIEGFDVVQAIGDVETFSTGRPKVDVVMDSLRRFDPNDTITQDTPTIVRHVKPLALKARGNPRFDVCAVPRPARGPRAPR